MSAGLRGILRKQGSSLFFCSPDTGSHTDQRGEAFSLSLFFSTTEISYLIIGLWHLLEPIPLCGENCLCAAAQLKPLQFVNLLSPLPCGGPGGKKPDVQWVTPNPRTLEDRPQAEGEQSHAALFNKHQNKDRMQPRHFTTFIWYVDTWLVFWIPPEGFFFFISHGSFWFRFTWEGEVKLLLYTSHDTGINQKIK